ncbi:MAG: sensor histidine kinase [Bryobacteraceae bacterium]
MPDGNQPGTHGAVSLNTLAVPEAESLLGALGGMFSLPRSQPSPVTEVARKPSNGDGTLGLDLRYQTLLEQIPAVVFMAALDDGRAEAYVSPHIEAVLGFTREEWLEDPVRWYTQIYPDDRSRWNIEAANFLLSGQPLRSVYRVVARDGHVVWFHCEAKMVRKPDGQPWFIHGVGIDITELKLAEQEVKQARDELERRVQERTAELAKANADLRAQIAERIRAEAGLARRAEELARSNKDLEQFAYSASHDLQEPIRNVSICAQLLSRRYRQGLDPEGESLLETVITGAKQMESLVLDLLEYTHVARDSETPRDSCDANEVLARVLHNLEAQILSSGAQISHDPLPVVFLPSVRLQQILQNLISNAIKYRSSATPCIHVSASAVESRGWQFSVKDNGIGIDPKYHDKIFGIFKRLHTKDRYPGTGIGLAICKRIVDNAGGKIWVESELGRGSDFRFFIPASPPQSAGPPEDNSAE